MKKRLVLGSTSPYRRELLSRLQIPFDTATPDIDETPLPHETPRELVRRLSIAKAQAVATKEKNALVIGGDQVAVCGERILGKPGDRGTAIEQLEWLAGNKVMFETGLCLLDSDNGDYQFDIVPTEVRFKDLTRTQIEAYVDKEPAFNCAGAFKSEGLGVALTDAIIGDDPNALIGLPLVRLCQMLATAGMDVLEI